MSGIGFLNQNPVIDLNQLAAYDPEAAQLGMMLNNPAYGGVDHDGRIDLLQWSEFAACAQHFVYYNPAYHWPMQRLQAALQQIAQGAALPGPGFGQPVPVPPPAPPHPLMNEPWAQPVAVSIPQTAPTEGPAVAHGGLCIMKMRSEGEAYVTLPLPSVRPGQTVDADGLELVVVDDQGRPVEGIISQSVEDLRKKTPEKQVLRLVLDLEKLPDTVFLRWSVPVNVSSGEKDVDAPVPVSALDDVRGQDRIWLSDRPMIQVEAPEITQLAAQIRARSSTVQEIVSNALAAIAQVRQPWPQHEIEFQNDALSFLQTGYGECVAHANLFAALMRANGVPTRIVSGIQRGQAQNMHYRNEYELPGVGWVHVEPQGSAIQSDRAEWIETGLVYPEMERQGGAFENYDGIHQFSMIGQETTPTGRPIAESRKALTINGGLLIENEPHGMVAIHGA